ncbi:MAG: Type IV pilus biogenesis and competence protein PilQ [Syntrophus sp. SKADARSKE-3]|nr:Type IV pilus biogenesis and competence protein PilQ [Syntrophus sp. SKADARSKE-3]
MKSKASWLRWGLLLFLLMFFAIGSVISADTAPSSPQPQGKGDVGISANTGYFEDILFEKLGNKERVSFPISKKSVVHVENTSTSSVTVTLDNLFIPTDLKNSQGEGKLTNVVRVLSLQKMDKGSPVAVLTIELQKMVPYRVIEKDRQLVLDFDVSSLQTKNSDLSMSPMSALPGAGTATTPIVSQKAQKAAAFAGSSEKTAKSLLSQKITLDFQEANIKSVLRLMSEQGSVNIVSGDDVKGNVTLYIKDVPWQQALDTILEITGLIKEESGDIVIVRTPAAKNAEDTVRSTLQASKRKLEDDLNTEKSRKGLLQQVMIEAKIVEITDTFSRNLGIQWGYGSSTTVGSGNYPFGILAGTNPPSQTGGLTSLTTGVALTPSALAVNFPAAIAPSIGIVAGSAYSLITAQLSALEQTSNARIISTPRVLTMEDKKAILRQGSEIPVVTPATSTSPATTTYKPAELRLEVQPKITADGRISMIITANNDRPDTANKDLATGNMPVLTNKIDSNVVVNNGDTVVIGGIIQTQDTIQETGVPWLAKIPVLGWLFKQESITKIKKELLIFVTPRIIKDASSQDQARAL